MSKKKALGPPNWLKLEGLVSGPQQAMKALQTFSRETPYVGRRTCAERRSEAVFSRQGQVFPGKQAD